VVLATVAAPPSMATAPPFTRMFPAALRLVTMVLSTLSPVSVSKPVLGEKVALIAIVVSS
jgi:hypothetical protein